MVSTMILDGELFFLTEYNEEDIENLDEYTVIECAQTEKVPIVLGVGDDNKENVKPLCFKDETSLNKVKDAVAVDYKNINCRTLEEDDLSDNGLYLVQHASEYRSGNKNLFAMIVYAIIKTRPKYSDEFEKGEAFATFMQKIIRHAADTGMSDVAEEVIDMVYQLTTSLDRVSSIIVNNMNDNDIIEYAKEAGILKEEE